MADITMCSGELCPMKQTCYRHTAPVAEYRQAYFIAPPFVSDEEIHCDYYWPNKH